ncbi:MAG TPA: LacI family DNA-binding transcriptional regulator [Candidatus Scatomonas pullistercoris]|uniref:LacI family DNA-binding transcriptional regulator n=1 Tax=Candidatus Scatomonas pullistercoris TaxID=2840920 RepID=A0A9D1P3A4_9FIRM|nr:LacI family DNA-binding transcriptional regulator [Candidatus Scatomonas pullistercoris]
MATLKELAEYTGFSITTISRVLNNDPTMSVSDATRTSILDAAGKLHYRTSAAKVRSRTSRGRHLKFAMAEMLSPVEQLEDPYYLYLKNYAVQRCTDLGYTVIPISGDPGLYTPLKSEKIDGILAIGIFSEEQIEAMASLSDNLVFLDSAPDELHFDSVVLNFQLGVEQAVDYFLEHGHREIGFLGPCRKLDQKKRPAPEVRREIFIRYMKQKDLYHPEFMLDASPMTASASRKYLEERIAAGGPMPTAILTANEEAAIGAAGALRSCQMSIPRDLSIISFNDTPLSALTDPPLTSVSTHVEAMSATAVDLLTRRASGQLPDIPLKIVVPPSLISRESVLDKLV